jgi:hypothetical protein
MAIVDPPVSVVLRLVRSRREVIAAILTRRRPLRIDAPP